jgi:hypothetical protein
MRTLAKSRASLSPSRNSPIDLFALYAPPRERVRGAVSVQKRARTCNRRAPGTRRGKRT